MDYKQLTVYRRGKSGKGVSRKLRKQGFTPGILYGREVERPIPVYFNIMELKKALGSEHGENSVLDLKIEDGRGGTKSCLAMVQDYQFHPVKRSVIHVDFITINPEREVDVDVPVETEGKPIGVQRGGLLIEIFHELPIRCLPDRIPPKVKIDVSGLDIGQSIKVSELELPEGVRPLLPLDQAIVSITTVKEEKEGVAGEAEAVAEEVEVTPVEKKEEKEKEKVSAGDKK